LLLVLIVIAFALTFGLAGVILAPPFAAAIQIAFTHYTRSRSLPGDRTSSIAINDDVVRQMEILKTRVADMQASLNDEEEEIAPERVNLIKRLDQLIKEADNFLETSR
jgi:phosphopantothenate synthetase